MILPTLQSSASSSRNACKLCTPLGACLVFRGIEGCVPVLHGSQGCATYIRRYMISHFKEPVDIASSNFSEQAAIYGGGENLRIGLENVLRQYKPALVGLATTCLSETIGDDLPMHMKEFIRSHTGTAESPLPPLVHVSTASYRGTHVEGFHDAVRATIEALNPASPAAAAVPSLDTALKPAARKRAESWINLLPNMVSPEDLRHLKDLVADFAMHPIILPDYSDTLDGPSWEDYHRIPPGGTPVQHIRRMSVAQATIEFASTVDAAGTGGAFLANAHQVPRHLLPLPIGVRATDLFLRTLSSIAHRPIPRRHHAARGRLLDSFIDAHKHCFGLRALVYGEQDLAVGLAALLAEVGIVPVLVGSGQRTGRFAAAVRAVTQDLNAPIQIHEGIDFVDMEDLAADLKPDLVVGHSKGYSLARKIDAPLIRVGFPVHDRIGGARILHLGYQGAQRLFDLIVNAIIERKQQQNPWGYSYM